MGCDATGGDCVPPAITTPDMEPMVLRAAAGECITVTLTNSFDPSSPAFTNSNTPLAAAGTFFQDSITFASVTANPSTQAGLHPQMLAYDAATNSGLNVGFNYASGKNTTAGPGENVTYTWYAGIIAADGTGTPIEFGVVNLLTADPLLQTGFGLAGAMVIEPAGSTWDQTNTTPISTVKMASGESFVDIVLITIDGVVAQIEESSGTAATNVVLANYGTEPIAERIEGKTANVACQYSNQLVGGEPDTPIFTASPEQPVRFRVVHPWGNDQQVFELYGHLWQEEPYNEGSTEIAMNPSSEWQGFRAGWGSTDRINVILGSAGGPFGVEGDYLYRLRDVNLQATNGVWGLFRVGANKLPPPPVAYCIGGKPDGAVHEVRRPGRDHRQPRDRAACRRALRPAPPVAASALIRSTLARVRLAANILLAGALSLSGCGGTDSDSPSPSPAETIEPAQQKPDLRPAVELPIAFASRVEHEGIALDVAISPLRPGRTKLTAYEGARVRFTIRDTVGSAPLSGVYPAGWMQPRSPGAPAPDARGCAKLIEGFVSGSIFNQPEVDLNTFTVLVLNGDATISVVDPRFGFGGSKLLTMIPLGGPGHDWALREDASELFVSVPDAGEIAIIDTHSYDVVAQVQVGEASGRVLLQHDEQYLWTAGASTAGDRRLVAIDTRTRQVAASLELGVGAHDLAISADDRFLFVSDALANTITVIDTRTLTPYGVRADRLGADLARLLDDRTGAVRVRAR